MTVISISKVSGCPALHVIEMVMVWRTPLCSQFSRYGCEKHTNDEAPVVDRGFAANLKSQWPSIFRFSGCQDDLRDLAGSDEGNIHLQFRHLFEPHKD